MRAPLRSDTANGVSHHSPSEVPARPRGRVDGPRPQRRGSWSLPVPEHRRALRRRAWDGSADWLARVAAWLVTDAGEFARTRVNGPALEKRTSVDLVLRLARALAPYSDRSTGRGVTVAFATVARDAQLGESSAKKAMAVLKSGGFVLDVVEGRHLDKAERKAARAAHGGHQVSAATVRHLVIPEDAERRRNPSPAVEGETLPRRGLTPSASHLLKNSPTHARKRARTAARSGAVDDRGGSAVRARRGRYSPGTQRMAGQLIAELPILWRWRHDPERPDLWPGEHPGTVCRVIAASPIDTERFAAADVLALLERAHAEVGLTTLDGGRVSNPLGYLATLLRRAAGYAEVTHYRTRSERAAEVDAQRAERRRAAREARSAEAELRARLDSPAEREATAAILAQMALDYAKPTPPAPGAGSPPAAR